MGASVASEPETQHTSDYFKAHAPIYGAIDWHSYSQLILRPWGWTSADAPDERLLKTVGDEMKAVAEAVHGVRYVAPTTIFKKRNKTSDGIVDIALCCAHSLVRIYTTRCQ
jgi:hypothetical protein